MDSMQAVGLTAAAPCGSQQFAAVADASLLFRQIMKFPNNLAPQLISACHTFVILND